MIVTCFPSHTAYGAGKGGSLASSHFPGEDLEITEGWEIFKESAKPHHPVIVAVIDTGIDVNHPDLASHIWTNKAEIPDNGIDDDGNGYIDDIYGWDFYNDDNTVYDCEYTENGEYHSLASDCDDHGTHVAGIIAAEGTGSDDILISGLAGVGEVSIMTLKIHGGKNRKGKLSDAIKAIKYAEAMGASVCNISWGTYTCSDALASAIEHSRMLFVCAAGNDGTDNDDHPIYPASFGFPNIISTGFTDHDCELTYSSNYGKNTVDIMVPSTDIMSTVVGGYGCMGGSSMAAAHVSAIAALIYAGSDHTWAASVKEVIMNSINTREYLDLFSVSGGIPSLKKALTDPAGTGSDFLPPTLELNIGYDENGISLSFVPRDEGGSGVCRINY
ncbi:MAG: S8 family serine peptidase, partial [Lachnospiraceae bacterium]|nr:S8 family serine peptidase [Lachnospiraceae bacterium]